MGQEELAAVAPGLPRRLLIGGVRLGPAALLGKALPPRERHALLLPGTERADREFPFPRGHLDRQGLLAADEAQLDGSASRLLDLDRREFRTGTDRAARFLGMGRRRGLAPPGEDEVPRAQTGPRTRSIGCDRLHGDRRRPVRLAGIAGPGRQGERQGQSGPYGAGGRPPERVGHMATV